MNRVSLHLLIYFSCCKFSYLKGSVPFRKHFSNMEFQKPLEIAISVCISLAILTLLCWENPFSVSYFFIFIFEVFYSRFCRFSVAKCLSFWSQSQWASDIHGTSIGHLYDARTSYRRPLDVLWTSDTNWDCSKN